MLKKEPPDDARESTRKRNVFFIALWCLSTIIYTQRARICRPAAVFFDKMQIIIPDSCLYHPADVVDKLAGRGQSLVDVLLGDIIEAVIVALLAK